ncbi:MAG: class I SAM-dependent methyltransferase [Atribacterota bacterium]|nr:class I SAM-dependent methyltransferase [Atribacterota bacterium]
MPRLIDKSWFFAQRIGTYLPFTYWRIIWVNIDKKAKSILDVGCADGDLMGFINNRKKFDTVGIDIYEPYLEKCRSAKTHDKNILCDVRSLHFEDKSYDVVLFLETLEHLERAEGLKVIQDIERIARTEVIISTPVSFVKQQAYNDNIHQEHRSFWNPCEMRQMGYKVRGIGIRENLLIEKVRNGMLQLADKVILRKKDSVSRSKTNSISYAFKLADFLLRLPYYLIPGPFVYFFPKLAGHMICIKRLNPSNVTEQGDNQ